MYQAALLCADCGEAVRLRLINEKKAPADAQDEHTYDSDEFPKGPYPEGGGEADCPQHCDACGLFLENPLTSDGYDYVKKALEDFKAGGHGCREVLEQWSDYYDIY